MSGATRIACRRENVVPTGASGALGGVACVARDARIEADAADSVVGLVWR